MSSDYRLSIVEVSIECQNHNFAIIPILLTNLEKLCEKLKKKKKDIKGTSEHKVIKSA